MNPIPLPMVQGVRTDHSNIEVRLNGRAYLIKSVNWDDSLEPQAVEANAIEAIGWTTGKYKAKFEVELYKAEQDNLESDLYTDPTYILPTGEHAGIKQMFFPVTINHRQSSSIPFTTRTFYSRITNQTESSGGSDAHSTKNTCVATPINRNGIPSFAGQTGIMGLPSHQFG
jgi:hypothetical protein